LAFATQAFDDIIAPSGRKPFSLHPFAGSGPAAPPSPRARPEEKNEGGPVKRILLLSLLFALLHAATGECLQFTTGNDTLRILGEYRSAAPGELLKITLLKPLDFRKAELTFCGETWTFGKGKKSRPFLLAGIDPFDPPEAAELQVCVELQDGSRRCLSLPLAVEKTSFPKNALSVHPKFVDPDGEDQERIVRDRASCRSASLACEERWKGKGDFILPAAGSIGKNFGEERIFNGTLPSRHRGVDIGAKKGSPVKAANGGTVVLAEGLHYGGKTVILNHGKGLHTIYCHLSKIRVKAGARVRKGQVIGSVGATGRATGPHLHWGMTIRETTVNPLSVFSLSFP
jgi:hypothetical protein